MTTPNKTTKASRAIMDMARQWEDIIEELPMLEEAGNLSQHITMARSMLDALKADEKAARERLASLGNEEIDVKATVKAAQDDVTKALKQAEMLAAKGKLDAKQAAAHVLDDASRQADKVVSAAKAEASKIVADGKASADAYRDGLKKQIKDLESRVAALKNIEARTTEAHTAAQESLAALRKTLGVGGP